MDDSGQDEGQSAKEVQRLSGDTNPGEWRWARGALLPEAKEEQEEGPDEDEEAILQEALSSGILSAALKAKWATRLQDLPQFLEDLQKHYEEFTKGIEPLRELTDEEWKAAQRSSGWIDSCLRERKHAHLSPANLKKNLRGKSHRKDERSKLAPKKLKIAKIDHHGNDSGTFDDASGPAPAAVQNTSVPISSAEPCQTACRASSTSEKFPASVSRSPSETASPVVEAVSADATENTVSTVPSPSQKPKRWSWLED